MDFVVPPPVLGERRAATLLHLPVIGKASEMGWRDTKKHVLRYGHVGNELQLLMNHRDPGESSRLGRFELYGGAVRVESRLGQGANFILIFPAKALMKFSK